MRIFKNSWFDRFAVKEEISDGELRKIINQLEYGKAVSLGGSVYKLRYARHGEGKAGGYRVIVFFKTELYSFFVYCFKKAEKGNISNRELETFKEAAKEYFSMTAYQLQERVEHGQLIEL